MFIWRSFLWLLPVSLFCIDDHLVVKPGASFGVIKAFLDADLLPRIVTGTSAGGLVAALLCTRTDAELREILVPKLADMITACEDPINVWVKRWYRTGARFSTIQWARKVCSSML